MGDSGKSAQAPTFDPAATAQTGAVNTANVISGAQQIVPVLGNLERGQTSLNDRFNLRRMVAPGETFYSKEFQLANKALKALEGARTRVNKKTSETQYLVGGKWVSADAYQSRLTAAQGKVSEIQNRPIAELKGAFADQFAARDSLLGSMTAAQASSPEYLRMQEAYGRGITAQQTDAGALGDRLMQTAMAKMDQGGQLSPEAARDAVQSARSGMAARGLATSNSGLAAEFLNRDRYSREREFQNLGFAQSVQTQDLGRRQTNTEMRDNTNRYNMGLLGTSAQMADAEQARRLGLQQNVYNFGMQTDPRMMLAGMGSPLSNMTGLGAQLANVNLTPQYSGGQFSSGGGAGAAMGAGGALLGAGVGALLAAPTGGMSVPMGMALGSSLGGATGSLGGSFFR
jgi:hypothetical protein